MTKQTATIQKLRAIATAALSDTSERACCRWRLLSRCWPLSAYQTVPVYRTFVFVTQWTLPESDLLHSDLVAAAYVATIPMRLLTSTMFQLT